MYEIRQEQMNMYIQEHEAVTIKELQGHFNQVSLMTIHRDLDALAEAGFVTKVRGGAKSIHHQRDLTFTTRAAENRPGKTRIAQKAVALINEQGSIFIDCGTTCLALANILPPTPAVVTTTGLNVAIALANLQGPEIVVCPGQFHKENITVSGPSTLQFLETINIDLAFIGVSGYAPGEGFTCGDEAEMHAKRSIIRRARKTALLCDQTKFRRLMPYTFATLSDVDYVVTDKPPSEEFQAAAKAAGVTII